MLSRSRASRECERKLSGVEDGWRLSSLIVEAGNIRARVHLALEPNTLVLLYANLLTPSPTLISAAPPPSTLLPAIFFCLLNSFPNASLVLFFSVLLEARSCFTASLRAFFCSADSPRGRLIVSGRAARGQGRSA